MGESAFFAPVQSSTGSDIWVVEQQLDCISHLDGRFYVGNCGLRGNLSVRLLKYFATVGLVLRCAGIKVRIGALLTKEARTSGFREYSRQSAHTALKKLQEAGLIRVRGARRPANQGIVIDFTPKFRDMLTRKPKLNTASPPPHVLNAEFKVCPTPPHDSAHVKENHSPDRQPTPAHNNTHVKKVETYKSTITSNNQDPNFITNLGNTRTSDIENVIVLKQPTKPIPKREVTSRTKTDKNQNGEIQNLNLPKKPSKQDHSVLWSAIKTAEQQGWKSKKLQAIYYRGWLEINFPELLAPTNFEWPYWRNKWHELGRYGRDEVCKTQILPALTEKTSAPTAPAPVFLPAPADKTQTEYEQAVVRVRNYVDRGEISESEAVEMLKAMRNLCNKRAQN